MNHLTIAVNLMWLAQGVMQAANEHLAKYRSTSPAAFKDKQEEGRLLNQCTDLMIGLELTLQKKYNANPKAIKTMQDTGMKMREVFHRLLTETDPAQVHKMFNVIQAAVKDEVRIVDDCMTTTQYLANLPDGTKAYITQGEDGLWRTPQVAAAYKEAVYCLGALEELHRVKS